ncbi:potassium channel family protein [Chondrinema litorale]|uniref:potassium channel family protein n=1 Tax=Chondrinema litorale TaxID=2994555 RepID=UPI0025438278|nr:potassium channel family protein [Chondrinema litorale]UZR93523.1 potassium channel family protein [Chondrinema litorale]
MWLIQLSLLFLFIFLAFSISFYFAEEVSWGEAFWQSWQTLTTVGYGNRPAETVLGRWATVILCTAGIAVLGSVFTAAFDYRQHLLDKKKLGLMHNPFKNGYIIFNFPGDYQVINFISELRSVEEDAGVCIVDSSINQLPENISILPNVHFIRGNTLSRETYEMAALKDNKAVIVFPIKPSVPDSDGATKTIVDLIDKFVEDQTRILHILVDPKNAWMFDDSKSTQVMESFELFAIVQECQDKYSSEIFEKLLLNSKGANPKTVRPKLSVGWTWEELQSKMIKTSKLTNTKCNLFAHIRNNDPETCPDMDLIIEETDYISIIAYNNFNWADFEKNMAES